MTTKDTASMSLDRPTRTKRRRKIGQDDINNCVYLQDSHPKDLSLSIQLLRCNKSSRKCHYTKTFIRAVILLQWFGVAFGYATVYNNLNGASCFSCRLIHTYPQDLSLKRLTRPSVRLYSMHLYARHGRNRSEERRDNMYDDPSNMRVRRQGNDKREISFCTRQSDDETYSDVSDTALPFDFEQFGRVKSPQRLDIRTPVDDLSSPIGGTLQTGQQMSPMQQSVQQERNTEEDDNYDDYDYDDEDESLDYERDASSAPRKAGNYWSNPAGSELSRQRCRPRRVSRKPNNLDYNGYEQYIDERGELGERYRSTRTFRNNIGDFPKPPSILSNLYNNLFWYGFDPSEGNGPDDEATMFGGTRGKFNGLAFLREAEKGFEDNDKKSFSRNRRSTSARRVDDDPLAFLDDDSDYYTDDYDFGDEYSYNQREQRDRSKNLPPARQQDTEYRYYKGYEREDETRRQKKSPNQRRRRSERSNVDNDYYDIRDPRQQQILREDPNMNRNGFAFGLSSLLEAFMGMDEDQRDLLAREYDLKNGIASRANEVTRPLTRNSAKAYSSWRQDREVVNMEDISDYDYFDVEVNSVDLDTDEYPSKISPKRTQSREEERPPTRPTTRRKTNSRDDKASQNDAQTVVDRIFERKQKEVEERKNGVLEEINSKSSSRFEKDVSWEKRDEALDRIPPEGIEGWGPNGNLPTGVDARKQASIDAKEEIEEAEKIVDELRLIAQEVGQDLKNLRAEAKAKRRDLTIEANRRRVIIFDLRQIERDIEIVTDELFDVKEDLDDAILLVEELRERHGVLLNQVSAEEFFQNSDNER